MNQVVGNGNCTIYHTRSFEREPEAGSHAYMLINKMVHVLEIHLHPGQRRRKKDRVRVQVRLWQKHTPHFETLLFEAVVTRTMNREDLLFRAGTYLEFFKCNIYRHFNAM